MQVTTLYLCLLLTLSLSLPLPTYVLSSSSSSSSTAAVCTTDWDCSLGGVCPASGRCECDIWWTGDHCQYLHLREAKRLNGFNLAVNTTTWTAIKTEPTHTWCTSIKYDPDSQDYFAVISYMLNHCTLDAWETNSQVVSVRSESPEGPFNVETMQVLLPPFAHNPKVVRYTDGTWLLYFIGAQNGTIIPQNCSQGAEDVTIGCSRTSVGTNPGDAGARIAYAKSSRGPWTLWNNGEPLFGPSSKAWYNRSVTNPAPVILPNGTVLLYFTASQDFTHGPLTGNAIGVARASHWQGPYEVLDVQGGITSPDAEDPFVWQDHRGHYHLLVNTNTYHWMHGNLTGLYIGHAWSYDGLIWSDQFFGAVTTTVYFDDGSNVTFSYRERPDLYFNALGQPLALATGMTGVDGYADSFSFVQLICTDAQQRCYGGTRPPPSPSPSSSASIVETASE